MSGIPIKLTAVQNNSVEKQLKDLRAAVLQMAIALGAALPGTREVISALDQLSETQSQIDK